MSREENELGREAHYEQFRPEPVTGEPAVFTPDVVKHFNAELERRMAEPIDMSLPPELVEDERPYKDKGRKW